jgi:hypothetical protein
MKLLSTQVERVDFSECVPSRRLLMENRTLATLSKPMRGLLSVDADATVSFTPVPWVAYQ